MATSANDINCGSYGISTRSTMRNVSVESPGGEAQDSEIAMNPTSLQKDVVGGDINEGLMVVNVEADARKLNSSKVCEKVRDLDSNKAENNGGGQNLANINSAHNCCYGGHGKSIEHSGNVSSSGTSAPGSIQCNSSLRRNSAKG